MPLVLGRRSDRQAHQQDRNRDAHAMSEEHRGDEEGWSMTSAPRETYYFSPVTYHRKDEGERMIRETHS
jgi:hypothetical protein